MTPAPQRVHPRPAAGQRRGEHRQGRHRRAGRHGRHLPPARPRPGRDRLRGRGLPLVVVQGPRWLARGWHPSGARPRPDLGLASWCEAQNEVRGCRLGARRALRDRGGRHASGGGRTAADRQRLDPRLDHGRVCASLQANADLFTDVSPFWHSSTSETAVTDQETSADRSTVIAAARAAGIPVVPAVTDGTGRGTWPPSWPIRAPSRPGRHAGEPRHGPRLRRDRPGLRRFAFAMARRPGRRRGRTGCSSSLSSVPRSAPAASCSSRRSPRPTTATRRPDRLLGVRLRRDRAPREPRPDHGLRLQRHRRGSDRAL